MHLACMDRQQCLERMENLIEKIYGNRYTCELIQRHPAAGVGIEEIFSLWKQHPEEETLVVFSTACADEACSALVSELKHPRIALVDASALSGMIASHPEGMFPENEKQQRARFGLRRLAAIFINRKNAPRCLMMFVSMLMIYIFSSNILYLFSALFLLLIALISLRRRSCPQKLF